MNSGETPPKDGKSDQSYLWVARVRRAGCRGRIPESDPNRRSFESTKQVSKEREACNIET